MKPLDVVVEACNSDTHKAEARRFCIEAGLDYIKVPYQPGLSSETLSQKKRKDGRKDKE